MGVSSVGLSSRSGRRRRDGMSNDGSDAALANSWLLVDVATVVVVEAVVSVHLLRSASSIPHLWGTTRCRVSDRRTFPV